MNIFNKSRSELEKKYHFFAGEGDIMALDNNRLLALDNSQSALLLFSDTSLSFRRIPFPGTFESYIRIGSRFFVLTKQLDTYEFIPATNSLVKVRNDISVTQNKKAAQNTHFYCDFHSGRSFYLAGEQFYEFAISKDGSGLRSIFMTRTSGIRQPFLQAIVDPATGAHFFSTKINGFYTGAYTQLKSHPIPVELILDYKDPSAIIPYAVQKMNDSTVLIPNGTFLTIKENGDAVQKTGPPGFVSGRYSIALLPGGDIASATMTGLRRFTASTGYRSSARYSTTAYTESDNSPISLLLPEGDSLWFSTHKGIYNIKDDITRTIFKREKINNDGVFFEMRLFQRIDENSIMMSNQFGLFRLHTKAPFRIDTIQPGSLSYIRHILKIGDKLLLCSYKTGLFLYKEGQYLPVPLYERQQELKFCHNSFLDEDSTLWITTDKGLFKTSFTSILNSLSPGAPPPFFFKYGGIEDRAENIEFNGGGLPSYALLRNHTLVYPAINGVVSFNYKQLNDKVHFGQHSFFYSLRTTINKKPVTAIRDTPSIGST